MNTMRIMPEGWNNEVTKLNQTNVEQYIKNNETVQGLVKKCDDNYNLYVSFENGLNGIIPRKDVEGINLQENGLPKENLCTGTVNKFVQFKVRDIDPEMQLILSRREVQEEELDWVKNDLKIGEKVTGIVKNIKPYGAFVEIGGGVVGLVHIEDLSVARIKTPYERVRIGQKIEVVVKSIDREQGKVRETEKHKNGIFIELTPNLVGMAEYEEGLQYGQDVEVYIKKIDADKKKVKLLIV